MFDRPGYLIEAVKRFFKKRDNLLICALIAFHAAVDTIWLTLNKYASGPDEYNHLLLSSRIFKKNASIFYDFWPPFFHIFAACFRMLFGDGYIIAVMVNVVYIAVIFYALYYIGIKIFDRKTAILSVLILSLYPLFFRYSRFFSIDFALLAMVCLSICLLLYADDFQDRKNSILFGVSLGLGMLTKWSFIFFLFGPLLYSAYRIYLSKKNRRPLSSKKAARNFLLSLLLGACITAVWYLPALQVFIARLKTFIYVFVHNKPSMDSGEAVFGINNISQGFAALINEELSFLFFLVLCFAVFTYRKMIKEQKIVILWFIIPFCIFSLYFTKESRYMLPALPALALLSA
ncbi:MAG: glycosyltransferase family 39 protein, partial [Candidatus Omnitrophica bacterium]|nr:glycosyltransferase family 39 protein [Candidatus Omnitrophota bacterium]